MLGNANGGLLFLNPDCLIEPDTLEKLLPAFEQYPQTGMVGCLIRNWDGTEQEAACCYGRREMDLGRFEDGRMDRPSVR